MKLDEYIKEHKGDGWDWAFPVPIIEGIRPFATDTPRWTDKRPYRRVSLPRYAYYALVTIGQAAFVAVTHGEPRALADGTPARMLRRETFTEVFYNGDESGHIPWRLYIARDPYRGQGAKGRALRLVQGYIAGRIPSVRDGSYWIFPEEPWNGWNDLVAVLWFPIWAWRIFKGRITDQIAVMLAAEALRRNGFPNPKRKTQASAYDFVLRHYGPWSELSGERLQKARRLAQDAKRWLYNVTAPSGQQPNVTSDEFRALIEPIPRHGWRPSQTMVRFATDWGVVETTGWEFFSRWLETREKTREFFRREASPLFSSFE